MPNPVTVNRVVDVSDWFEAAIEEQMGMRDKLWLIEPTESPSLTALMKLPRKRGDIPESGADLWAEVLVSAIGRLIQVTTAEAAFAIRGELGPVVISYRIPGDLSHGNELLAGVVEGYDSNQTNPNDYNLTNIEQALAMFSGSETGMTAFESFVGYLCLDALVANTDRHHQNWAVQKQERTLAPSYDHGSSLGFNANFNAPPIPRTYAVRGKSNPFGQNLVELATDALHRISDEKADVWRARIGSIERRTLERLVLDIPSGWMSEAARKFVVELVLVNQERLLS